MHAGELGPALPQVELHVDGRVDEPTGLQSVGQRHERGGHDLDVDGRRDRSRLLHVAQHVGQAAGAEFVVQAHVFVGGMVGVGGGGLHVGEQFHESGHLGVVADEPDQGLGGGFAHGGGVDLVALAQDRDEQFFFGAEVVQQPALAQPDRLGELGHRGGEEAAFGDGVQGGLQDLFPPFDAFPVGSAFRHRSSLSVL
nr:hypothetical protein [Nocardia tengchongensis]